LQYQRKGTHLNTIERFFIYKEYLITSQLNDEFNINPNKIFEAILKPKKNNPTSHPPPTPDQLRNNNQTFTPPQNQQKASNKTGPTKSAIHSQVKKRKKTHHTDNTHRQCNDIRV